jgi:hypothetical protein
MIFLPRFLLTFQIRYMQRKLFLAALMLHFLSLAVAQDAEPASRYFIKEDFFSPMGLSLNESNNLLQVWINKNKEKSLPLERVVDIRWTFESPKKAAKYLKQNLKMQSEGGRPYEKSVYLYNASDIHIYREDPTAESLYSTMGLMKVHWYFIFRIDKVMIKVFTAGENTPFEDAYRIALKAAETVMDELKIPYQRFSVLPAITDIPADFREKLEKAGMVFTQPAGFGPEGVKQNRDARYLYAVTWPGAGLELRYMLYPFDSTLKVDYKMLFLLDVLNTSGQGMDVKLSSKDLDKDMAKKNFNADAVSIVQFEPKSEFGKGYKFCRIICMQKEGRGHALIYFLANDEKMLNAMPQVLPISLRFK